MSGTGPRVWTPSTRVAFAAVRDSLPRPTFAAGRGTSRVHRQSSRPVSRWRRLRRQRRERERLQQCGGDARIAQLCGDLESGIEQGRSFNSRPGMCPERHQPLRHGDCGRGIACPEGLGDLADSPSRRCLRADGERLLTWPEDHGGAVIPMLHGVPIVTRCSLRAQIRTARSPWMVSCSRAPRRRRARRLLPTDRRSRSNGAVRRRYQ